MIDRQFIAPDPTVSNFCVISDMTICHCFFSSCTSLLSLFFLFVSFLSPCHYNYVTCSQYGCSPTPARLGTVAVIRYASTKVVCHCVSVIRPKSFPLLLVQAVVSQVKPICFVFQHTSFWCLNSPSTPKKELQKRMHYGVLALKQPRCNK